MLNKTIFLKLLALFLLGGGVIWILQGPKEQTSSISEAPEHLNPAVDSEIVELVDGETFNLTAEMISKELYGQTVTMLGYNNSIPGPTIKVKQNATVTIHFTNNTPFENTIHSHGVRMDNAYDGVPDMTQEAIQPGESFDYILTFPDPGTYWYHPHVREDMTQEMGLYGAFVVEPAEENYWNPVNREEIIFLDDLLFTANGLEGFYEDSITHSLMGRYGNKFFINGGENYELEVNQNETVRFTLVDAANARPFKISIEGVQLKLVGSDGGAYEKETFVDSIIIGPSERYIFEAYFDEPGEYILQNVTPNGTTNLGSITVLEEPSSEDFTKEAFENLRENTRIHDELLELTSYYEKEPDKKLKLNIEIDGMGGGMPCHQMSDGSWMGDCDEEVGEFSGIEWEDTMGMMNAMLSDDAVNWQIIDTETGAINEKIDWDFELGDLVLIEIKNDKNSDHPMQHPIHFHGQRFLVLVQNGTPNENLVWKDTVLIPTGDTVKILLEVSNPGMWMAHCHIAEHLHNGMMFDFKVD